MGTFSIFSSLLDYKMPFSSKCTLLDETAADALEFEHEMLECYDKEGGKNPVPAGSSSPRRRIPDSYGRNLDHDGPHRGRGFRGGRHRGRFGDHHSPPFAPASMGRGTASFGRGFPGPDYRPAEPFPPEGESFKRNNPNIPPREGDWICSEPTCGNLNFARRTHCNNCNKPRRDMTPFHMGGGGGLQGGFRGTRPRPPFIGGPPMGRGMGRGTDGYGSPPGVWGRGGPRAVDQVSPPRLGEKLPDFRPGRDPRDRTEYHDHYDYSEREKFERLPPVGRGFMMGYRDSKREDRFNDRRVDHDVRSDRRPPTPPPRSRWGRDSRERSRSPMRSASREYRRDSHPERLRDDRREGRRDRRNDLY
eukprot:Gb_22580 [translate_table: standard]